MTMATQETILLYVILGGLIGVIYGLRRIYFLERNLAELNVKIERLLEGKKRKRR
ncbi:MAG TPA: hypothetical protein VFE88_01860 [Candidatus Nanoarchaeia archaeon]|nr:hypothetical protein [Candidatus Nanoarchaeia archaeon]